MLSPVPVLALAALAPLASAFSNTHPVLAWSSHSSPILDGLSSTRPSSSRAGDVYASILNHDDVCDFDAVVLVDHPGLHASDLRTLSPSSPLASLLRDAPSSVQLPYVRRSDSDSVHAYANALVERCGARLTSVDLGTSDLVLEQGSKHVVLAYVPALEGAAPERKDAMQAHANAFAALTSTLPKHLILFTGSPLPPSSLSRRTPLETSPSPALRQQPPNTPLPSGGILKRYQLLTPALITSLLLTFFVLLPAVLFGVSALASIQSPLRVEAPKGFSAHEKKTQ